MITKVVVVVLLQLLTLFCPFYLRQIFVTDKAEEVEP